MRELNEKLAKWAGFKQRGMSYTGIRLWVAPDEVRHFDKVIKEQQGQEYPRMPDKDNHYKLPDFPSSLDACFEWLVPKLKGYSLSKPTFLGVCVAIVYMGESSFEGVELNPILALCLAIEKLIDGEK